MLHQAAASNKKLLCLDWDETVTNVHWHNFLSGSINPNALSTPGLDVRAGQGLNVLTDERLPSNQKGLFPLDVLLIQGGGFKNEAHLKQFLLAFLKEHHLAITTFSNYPEVIKTALHRLLAPEMSAQEVNDKIYIRAGFPISNAIDKMLAQFQIGNVPAVKETIYNILRIGDSAEKILSDLVFALNMNEEQIKESLFVTRADKSLVKLEGRPPVLLKGDPNDLICKQEHIRDAMLHFNVSPESTFLMDDSQRNIDNLNADSPNHYSKKTGKTPLVVLPRDNLFLVERRWANPEPKDYLGVACDRLQIVRPEILQEREYDAGCPLGSSSAILYSNVASQSVSPATLAAAFSSLSLSDDASQTVTPTITLASAYKSAQARHGAVSAQLNFEKKKEAAGIQDKMSGAAPIVEGDSVRDKKNTPQ